MAVDIRRTEVPHIAWIDLEGQGIVTECAVMRQDGRGNVYFFRVDQLDKIDKERLARIVLNRNAPNFELWDLMSNITLNNGVNALEYFHQLVQVITPSGQIIQPSESRRGVPNWQVSRRPSSPPPQEGAVTVSETARPAQPAQAAAKPAKTRNTRAGSSRKTRAE